MSDETPNAQSQEVPARSADECAAVLARVYEFLDNELDTADGDQIRRHLADCEGCLDRFDVEQAVKALVFRSCGGDRAPEQLRIRVLTSIVRARRRQA